MSNWLKSVEKFNQRLNEFIIRGENGIKEFPIDGADTKGWIYIGEIAYGGGEWRKENKRKYLLVFPQYTQEDINRGKSSFIEKNISVNENTDGSDGGHYFYNNFDSRHDKIQLNEIYKNSVFALLFKNYIADSDNATQQLREQKHKEFMSRVNVIGDNVLMHHISDVKITDGYIKSGMPKQNYSNNNDWGVYLWASKNTGIDQSNAGDYRYYCIVPLEECYDVENNVENFKDDKELLAKYPYMLKDWKNGQAVACQTKKATKIWRIYENGGKWYDEEWNEVEKPSMID